MRSFKPPVARVEPKKLEKHGSVRIDDYFWMRERDDPEVRRHLEAENAHTEAVMAHTEGLQKTLFDEFKSRIKQTDVSVPYLRDGSYYYARTEDGKNYPIYCRKKGSLDAEEQVTIDVNAIAEGHDFCSVRPGHVRPKQDVIGFAVDTVGRRFYTLRFKNLETGETLPDEIPDVTGNFVWANDDKTLFYSKQDPETLRAHRIYRHVLGTDVSEDTLVYEEKDDTFRSYVFKTKSKKYIMIVSSQTLSDEYRYLDADDPSGSFRIFEKRRRNHEYGVDHYEDHFYIRTNHEATNFRLMKTPVDKTGMEHWTEVIPHREDVYLADVDIFKDRLVVLERKNGLLQIRIRSWSGDEEHYVDFGEPAYEAYPTANFEFDTKTLRYGYASMTTPYSVYDYHMKTREKTLLKRTEVGGGFDPENYATERIYVTARDGERVPLSLVYRKPFEKNGMSPTVLYGYGSYGASMDAGFSPYRISLLDRGFVYAIAHVRGGQEMGRRWYDDGKLLKKKNTFTDFIDCAEHLVEAGYADPKRVFAWGGSAGGLLVGAAVTMRPDLWAGVIADVPFVDVLTTMLDDDIPLTTSEFDEWGNPNIKEHHDYILSYSPYDQTAPAEYPALLLMTGFHDSQVQYWESAKWAAKLRTVNKGDRPILLKTEMEAGHGGPSGRDDRYREAAFQYAFFIDVAGVNE